MIPRPAGILAANLLGRRLGSDSINGYIVSYLGNSREFPDHHFNRNLAMNPQHDLQIRVRYQETDAMGRLHHANYPTYFELGRTEALRAEGHTYREIEEQGVFLVVSELTCRYLRPANYDDVLTLRTTMISARGARIEHEYQLFRGTLLLATGRTTVACVDKLGNVKRLPDWLQLPAQ